MSDTPRDRERRKAALDVATGAEVLRRHGRRAAPGLWLPDTTTEGITCIVGRDGHQVAVLTGLWASSTACYLQIVRPDTAFRLAELMWLSEPLIRQGQMPSRVQTALVGLARAITEIQPQAELG